MPESGQSLGLDLQDVHETRKRTTVAGTTPGPIVDDAQRFVQTTYTTCVTFPNSVHCGVHEPILDASNDAGSVRRRGCIGTVAAGGMLALLLFLA